MDLEGMGNSKLRGDEVGGLLCPLPHQGEFNRLDFIRVVPGFAHAYSYEIARGPVHYLSE